MESKRYPYCQECRRYVNSYQCMPIYQHSPSCSFRIAFEEEHPNDYPEFKGKEWIPVMNKIKNRLRKEGYTIVGE